MCTFARKGFDEFKPCSAVYHTKCFSVGAPFSTRRKGNAGLSFPSICDWPNFVCEACTVRSVLGRELKGTNDGHLMMLERMRIIDMAWRWAKGTHSSYQGQLKIIRQFEKSFDVPVLRAAELKRPANTPDIPLMWCMEAASTKLVTHSSRGCNTPHSIAFGTIRALRSAASQFYAWDWMISHPASCHLTKDQKLLEQGVRPTDSFAFSLLVKGLASRMGENVLPSQALDETHVIALDLEMERQYLSATSKSQQREAALGGLANVFLWLGWLRSGENFGLEWRDVSVLLPEDAATRGLPANVGMVELLLGPETKSNRTVRADVILAYTASSGLSPGKWIKRAREACAPVRSNDRIFCDEGGKSWTSSYFRKQFLYPCLRRLRALGDPLLIGLDDEGMNSIESRFWSLHCYRRGARSKVSQKEGNLRYASNEQIYEHGRWRLKRSSEPIDVMYRHWSALDRVKITLLCM